MSEGQYIYTVHHHHAYIAVGQDVIVLLLNSGTPNFHRIRIGHNPIQLVARDFGHETYLFVLYESNNRGRVAAYRKYSNRNWGKHGQHDMLVYSPEWFDTSKMSNVLFFSADDWHYSYKVTYVAVAVGYTIFFKELLDDFDFNINIPEPCDRVLSINFNENKQTLFVVCTNVTYYFSYIDYQIYESSLWNRTGLTYFSQDGRIAAIATNHSGDMTTVTVHGLHFEPVIDRDERVYQFYHFHHVASRSLIIQGVFVTVSNSLHYYCYIELLEFGIVCIDVEQALQNVRNEGILDDATLVLPNTHSVMCSSYSACPVMYTHKDLFVVQLQVCEQDRACKSIVMLFNMSSLENIANITGVHPDMHAYIGFHQPILISTSTHNGSTTDRVNDTQPQATHTISPSTLMTQASVNVPVQTPNELPTALTTDSAITPIKEATTSHEELLETCQNDLLATSTSYDKLLYVTITLCVCFCLAMLVTILVLVVMICINKRGGKVNTKE